MRPSKTPRMHPNEAAIALGLNKRQRFVLEQKWPDKYYALFHWRRLAMSEGFI